MPALGGKLEAGSDAIAIVIASRVLHTDCEPVPSRGDATVPPFIKGRLGGISLRLFFALSLKVRPQIPLIPPLTKGEVALRQLQRSRRDSWKGTPFAAKQSRISRR